MIKQLIKISFYSFIAFYVVQFIFLTSLIFFQSQTKESSEIWLGYPINYYKLYPNESHNYTTHLEWTNLFYNLFNILDYRIYISSTKIN